MVKDLTQADQKAIGEAIANAEQQTSAKIRIIIRPSSRHYRDFILLYGFILGSAVACALWFAGHNRFPLLLGTQLGIMLVVDLVLWLRWLCIRLVPRRLRHYHGAEAAHREYLTLHAGMPEGEPFVLLFISLAERYVHVMTNPIVHAKIPKNWDNVTGRFISSVRTVGLRDACIEAVRYMTEILSRQFPAN